MHNKTANYFASRGSFARAPFTHDHLSVVTQVHHSCVWVTLQSPAMIRITSKEMSWFNLLCLLVVCLCGGGGRGGNLNGIWAAQVVDASPVVLIPTAIVINDPTNMLFISTLGPLSMYRPYLPFEVANLLGMALVKHHLDALPDGGLRIGNQTFNLNPIMFNRARFNGTDDAFVDVLVSGSHRPMYITMPMAITPSYDDLTILVARACDAGRGCLVVPNGADKRLFVCRERDIGFPECKDRIGLRRFQSIISFLPDADYIAEAAIGNAAKQRLKTMSLVSFDSNFAPAASAATPMIAETYGLDIVFKRTLSSRKCDENTIANFVQDVRTVDADFLGVLGVQSEEGVCWANILRHMAKKEVDYFPRSMCLMGGLFESVLVDLTKTHEEHLLQYVYGTDALTTLSRAYAYRATSTPTHTELFPTTATGSTGGLTSAQRFFQDYTEVFGEKEAKNKYVQYASFGGAAYVILLHILEVSSGVVEPKIWQSKAYQVNYPSFFGNIQFDATGQNLGLRIQILKQMHLNPDTNNLETQLVSATSPYKDIVPAPGFSQRLFRSYLKDGDELVADWDVLSPIIGSAVLVLSTWSGLVRMKIAFKEYDAVYERSMPYLQIAYMVASFGIGGSWAFFLIVFQGVRFVPTDPTVRASLHVEIPLLPSMLGLLAPLVLVLAFIDFFNLTRKSRRLLEKNRHEFPKRSSTNSDDGSVLLDDGGTFVDFASSDVRVTIIDDPETTTRCEGNRPGDGGGGLCGLCGLCGVLRSRFINIPRIIIGRLAFNALIWCTCPFVLQYVFLTSLVDTQAQPVHRDADWIGYFVLGVIPMFMALLTRNHLYAEDGLCAILQCLTPILLHVVSMKQHRFVFVEEKSGVSKLDSDIGVLIVGLMSLLITIATFYTALKRSGTDNMLFLKEMRNVKHERNLAYIGLMESMHEVAELKRKTVLHQAYSRFHMVQRAFFENNAFLPKRSSVVELTSEDAEYLQTTYMVRLSQLLKELEDLPDIHITRDDVNMYVKSLQENIKNKKKQRNNLTIVTDAVVRENTNELTTVDKVIAGSGDLKKPVLSVQRLLDHPILRDWLEFAVRVGMSSESWYYVLAVEDYDTITDLQTKFAYARSIYALFIKSDSAFAINIPSTEIKRIEQLLVSTNPDLDQIFTIATREVHTLLKTNNFAFLSSHPTFNHVLYRLQLT